MAYSILDTTQALSFFPAVIHPVIASFPAIFLLITPLVLGIILIASFATKRSFSDEEIKAGFGFRLFVLVITLPPGLYGIWAGSVGCLTWLGGVMRHDELARSKGTHLFWLGMLAFGFTILLRGWLLPFLLPKKPEAASTAPSAVDDQVEPLPSPVRFDPAAIYRPEQPEKSRGQRMLRTVWPFCVIGLGIVMMISPALLDGQHVDTRINGHHRSVFSIAFDVLLYCLWGRSFGVVLILAGIAAIWSRILNRGGRSSKYNWPR